MTDLDNQIESKIEQIVCRFGPDLPDEQMWELLQDKFTEEELKHLAFQGFVDG